MTRAAAQRAFDKVDVGGDGFLDLGEVAEVLKLLDPDNPERQTKLWHLMDKLVSAAVPYVSAAACAFVCSAAA